MLLRDEQGSPLYIHSHKCIRGLSEVFDVQKRPWVNVDAAAAGDIAAQIEKCPSGALSYELKKRQRPTRSQGSEVDDRSGR